jgi:hypothetical protein
MEAREAAREIRRNIPGLRGKLFVKTGHGIQWFELVDAGHEAGVVELLDLLGFHGLETQDMPSGRIRVHFNN